MAKLMMTQAKVDALTTEKPQEDFYDQMVRGLILRVARSGKKVWRSRPTGVKVPRAIGSHPQMTLEQARTMVAGIKESRAMDSRVVVNTDGPGNDTTDPAPVRHYIDPNAMTVARLFEETLPEIARESARTESGRERMFRYYIRPVMGHRLAKNVRRADIKEFHTRITEGDWKALWGGTEPPPRWKGGGPGAADGVVRLMSNVWNRAMEDVGGWATELEYNPAQIRKNMKTASRPRSLTPDELGQAYRDAELLGDSWTAFVRLLLLLAVRVSNLRAMHWADVNLRRGFWTIPADGDHGRAFKGGKHGRTRAHLVALPDAAVEILTALRASNPDGLVVFPAMRSDSEVAHITNHTKALTRLVDLTGAANWTAHNARHTIRTLGPAPITPTDPRDPSGAGLVAADVDEQLGHADPVLGARVYDRSGVEYRLTEKRAVADGWGRYVVTLAARNR